MLTREQNDLLTRVSGPAPMGQLLRRYWHPVAGAAELDDQPIKPVRLFGEDLVLYRDLSGNHGLIDRHCPHRRADLAYGFVEPDGLRCSYHGWAMNAAGAVTSVPYDDIVLPAHRLKQACSIAAYPVRELAGMLWAYMGPLPAPELPVWEHFARDNGFCEVVLSDIPCNWLQCQENSIDPVHFEWLHENWPQRLKGASASSAARHTKVEFDEFEFGLTYRRLREGMNESDEMWTIGRVCLWPNGFYLGDHIEWRVPIDDENTLSVSWFYTRVPQESEPYVQERIPAWHSPIRDEAGRWITSHVINQDIVGWVGQGTIADRTRETLSASDKGIAMLRRRLQRDLAAIERGEDPSGLIRDPERAARVPLPNANAHYLAAIPRAEWLAHPFLSRRAAGNPWAAGQPDAVRLAYLRAMGFAG
ncbi:aromatic ring-hydroxylating dioxygenase subunit alpha [Novosphingobium flavum]|uniref:Aromatic ring-hydroxylating dioxygenase subunit alpha n=1 Tax=Novosphingobium flavum TaxID=1778672 RepID=A0A7X1FS85_9SPHN|nr:aromatic ring-hydroxylating dioxygenase subunit alpha [Novosphingobium flavum]MBC2665993.1 aromatic ring-hydroxylating dioxygenase subunit alpha [Novosphingobium flavum]